MNKDHWPLEKFSQWTLKEQQDFLNQISSSFPRMSENSSSSVAYPPLWSDKFVENLDLAEEWVFFGGTFDPWHDGHMACLKLLSPKKIVIVPDRNPWKETALNSDLCQAIDDLAKIVSANNHAVYPGFFAAEKSNPTIDWFSKVLGKKSLLIGADNLISFPKWKDYKKLLGLAHKIYVAPRLGSEGEEFDQVVKHCVQLGGNIVVLNRHDYEHLSSTDLRK